MAIEPYLFFNGCCEEAIAFYQKALGAEVLMLWSSENGHTIKLPGRFFRTHWD